MSVPILLVTGFLGAGKTTLINDLLQSDHGLRIAAIVNDFGAINIDAALLESASDSVIGLRNGCICCSLQGDLLRTLKQVLAGASSPDLIVIEASGVADPGGIMQGLLDPMIWHQASLDTVLCVIDVPDFSARKDDPLWLAQVRQSDVIFLAKTESLSDEELTDLHTQLAALGKRHLFDSRDPLPVAALLAGPGRADRQSASADTLISDTRFTHLEWEHPGPFALPDFQAAMTRLAPDLLRAKGFLQFSGRDGCFVFQLVGQRATLAPQPDRAASGCQLVLIGERDQFDRDAASGMLARLALTGDSQLSEGQS